MLSIAAQRSGLRQDYSLLAPIGGWNTRDAIAAMQETDAPLLDNWFPTTTGLISRKGYTSFCTGLASEVETLVEYHAGATRKFIGAAGGYVYDITSGTASSLGSGFSSAKWVGCNFNGYLNLVNGADEPQNYNGTTLAAAGWTGSGLTATNLAGVHAYKNRLYFWENSSQDFWYGGVNSITGTLTKFPLSRLGQKGGNLIAIKSITRDGGSGVDDLIAFFMSSGTVIVYTGSDPGDATNWSLQGVYTIGEPISGRTLVETKGDILVLTKSDAVSLIQAMQEGGFVNQPSKLSGAIASAARTYGANLGWQAVLYPLGNMILFNVPIASYGTYHQYVINTITGASCRFTGWNARCFGVYNGSLYFGGSGAVYKADTGYSDNGSNIAIAGQQAFSFLGGKSKKRLARFRPILKSLGTVSLTAKLAYDYGDFGAGQTKSLTTSGSPWDTSTWDVDYWSTENGIFQPQFLASGIGTAVSLKLSTSIKTIQLEWFRTDFSYMGLSRF